MTEAAKLSRMLFAARESLEMLADIVEKDSGKPDLATRALVFDIDEYRKSQGWNPHGFGSET